MSQFQTDCGKSSHLGKNVSDRFSRQDKQTEVLSGTPDSSSGLEFSSVSIKWHDGGALPENMPRLDCTLVTGNPTKLLPSTLGARCPRTARSCLLLHSINRLSRAHLMSSVINRGLVASSLSTGSYWQ